MLSLNIHSRCYTENLFGGLQKKIVQATMPEQYINIALIQ
jgi:hypothetical protein